MIVMVLKLRQHLIALIVMCVLFDSFICQKRRDDRRRGGKSKPRARGRGRQPPPEPEVQRVNCYYCSVNFFSTKFDMNNMCYNPNVNVTKADNEYLTTCAVSAKFCVVDITRLKGGLVQIDRKCGGSTCNYFCISKGYGAEMETCSFCCPGKPIINEELLEEGEVVPPYKCP